MHKENINHDATGNAGSRSRFGANKYARLIAAVVIAIIIICLLGSLLSSDGSSRTESYKKVTGSAGLNAMIAYDCKKSCDQKYSFNVYLFNADGQQVSVVRPDKDGRIRLALPGGNYVMLVGKQFGKDKIFPQEKLELKDGQELDVKLQYKEGTL